MHWRRWPILYRLLLVNGLVVAAGASVGTLLTQYLVLQSAFTLAVMFTAAGVLLSVGLNYFVLRAALRPLSELTQTVDRVQNGHTAIRADPDDQDPDIARLTMALNTMLDRLSAHTATIEAHRAQLQALSAQVITAQEEERKRIARELHDETSQSLAGLMIALERIEAVIPEELVEARRRLGSTRKLAHDTLEGLRSLVADLRPTVLDDLGLVSAIRWYATSRLEREGVDLVFEAQDIPRLPSRMETALFRIAQEAVNNVIRHADANHVEIRLTADRQITLAIRDDGRGFDVERVRNGQNNGLQHLGLFGVQERVAALGGQAIIKSTPGKGTLLQVEIPLDGRDGAL